MSIDANVDRVCAKMQARAKQGLEKYGATTERTDYTLLDWLINAQEEAMDFAVYLEAAKQMAQELVDVRQQRDEWREVARALASNDGNERIYDAIALDKAHEQFHKLSNRP